MTDPATVPKRSDDRVTRQIGAALRRLPRERGLPSKQLASRAGISRPMLSRYEHGRQQPTLSSLVKLLGRWTALPRTSASAWDPGDA